MITIEAIKSISPNCGVYLFYKENYPIYIGKAINIKARLASHIQNAKLDQKEEQIIANSDRIEIFETNSELNALLLESELIKKYRPKYNIVWKDDKSYLYIKITVKEPYPKIFIVRRENDGKSLYFGPFGSYRITYQLLRDIRKAVPFCTQNKIGKTLCFYAKIGLCDPCPNIIENNVGVLRAKPLQKQYRSNIKKIISILKGKSDVVVKSLMTEIKKNTVQEKYDQALLLRNKLYHLNRLLYERSFKDYQIHDLIVGTDRDLSLQQEIKLFLSRYFKDNQQITINRIECFDVSNLFGKEATASMVVFEQGRPAKKEYRRFRIKTVKQISDIMMLEETLTRRLKHENWPKPQLILVDGGKPQVRIALNVVQTLEGVGVLHAKPLLLGIAKNPDRVILGNNTLKTIRFKNNSPFFNVIRAIRDESHRFAKKYHLILRKKKMMI